MKKRIIAAVFSLAAGMLLSVNAYAEEELPEEINVVIIEAKGYDVINNTGDMTGLSWSGDPIDYGSGATTTLQISEPTYIDISFSCLNSEQKVGGVIPMPYSLDYEVLIDGDVYNSGRPEIKQDGADIERILIYVSEEAIEAHDGTYSFSVCYRAQKYPNVPINQIGQVCHFSITGYQAIDLLEAPSVQKIENNLAGPHIYWSEVEEATGYEIYRMDEEEQFAKIAEVTGTDYLDTEAQPGANTYAVKALGEEVDSALSESMTSKYLLTPQISSITNSSYGIRISWNEIPGADNYAIYRWDEDTNGSWKRIATVDSTNPDEAQWTDADAKSHNGTVFHYTVRAWADEGTFYSGCSGTGRSIMRLFTPTISDAVCDDGAIRVNWNYNNKADGYEVRIMSEGTVLCSEKVVGNRTLTDTLGSTETGKIYEVQVRSIFTNDAGRTYYSAWSKKSLLIYANLIVVEM